MFLRLSVILFRGAMSGEVGVCVVKGGMCGEGGMHGKGGHAWWRRCVRQGGMHGRGGMCGRRGVARGACVVGGGDMHSGETTTEAGGTLPTGMHSCCVNIMESPQTIWCFISEGWCSFDADCFLFHDVRYLNGKFHPDVWRRQDHPTSGKGECHGMWSNQLSSRMSFSLEFQIEPVSIYLHPLVSHFCLHMQISQTSGCK